MIIALLRIKNEARWIARVVQSILPVCGRILIFDASERGEFRCSLPINAHCLFVGQRGSGAGGSLVSGVPVSCAAAEARVRHRPLCRHFRVDGFGTTVPGAAVSDAVLRLREMDMNAGNRAEPFGISRRDESVPDQKQRGARVDSR
jgi:hypothetical protein